MQFGRLRHDSIRRFLLRRDERVARNKAAVRCAPQRCVPRRMTWSVDPLPAGHTRDAAVTRQWPQPTTEIVGTSADVIEVSMRQHDTFRW